MNNSILKRRLSRRAGRACAAILVAGGALCLPSCQDDLLTGTPSWLGSSIYEELENRGCFTQTLALINDPDLSETNYPEMLRRTGSMTLFVADDAAWERYLSARGLRSVSELPKSEKKNLLKGAMINNAYLIELLSNTPGDPPNEGACFRRASRVDIADSVPVMVSADFPEVNPARLDAQGAQVDYWSSVRDRASIKIYKGDAYRGGENASFTFGAAPMVHFLPDFMSKNDLTGEDLKKLTNGAASDVATTSYINGKRVVEQDVTCQNGYVHVLEDVPVQLPNMAEIVHSKPQFSIFSALLDRYSYPDFMAVNVENGHSDSLFVKRYFNSGKSENALTQYMEDGTSKKPSGTLDLDPGWNRYTLNTNTGITFQNDGAAMLVPTDDWMRSYLSAEGEGAAIGLKYGRDWRNVPDNVVLPFLNNCLQNSFVGSAPSKFASVKNTASEVMGIVPDDVDSCFMACNGVVYQLGKVFVAPEHQSVFFPAVLRADDDLSIMHEMIANTRHKGDNSTGTFWTLYEYQAYVNSMASTYSFILPRDKAFSPQAGEVASPDPFALTADEKTVWSFRYALNPSQTYFPVSATTYNLELDSLSGQWRMTDNRAATNRQPTSQSTANLGLINNRLEDVLENVIVVHGGKHAQTFHEGQEIYLNKAGGPIKVRFEGGKVTGIAGSYHASKGWWIPVDEELIFDQRASGNGVSYVVDSIPYSTTLSPYAAVHDTIAHPEFTSFARLLAPACSFVGQTFNAGKQSTIDYAFSMMGNYHYTIYVPQNSAIDELVRSKKLPTWETFEQWTDLKTELAEYSRDLQSQLKDYEKQLKEGSLSEAEFDALQAAADARQAEIDSLTLDATAHQDVIRSTIENFLRYHIQDGSVYLGGADSVGVYETATIEPTLHRFRRLNVSNLARTRQVTDAAGHVTSVINGEHSNLMTRQYIFTKSDRQIYGSSYVVVHLTDHALSYGDETFLPDGFPDATYPEWLQEWMIANEPNLARKRR